MASLTGKGRNGGKLMRPAKGETMNPNGRPRKYVSLLKESGYKLAEINDTIQAMMAMDMDELKTVWENPKATILEKTVANAMRKSLEKGSLYSLETLLTRVFGKPKEQTDITGVQTIKIVYADDDNIKQTSQESGEGT